MTHDTANPGAGGDTGSQTTDTPRIYAACLAAYNNGHLHGRWIDATQDPDDIQAEISAMLAASPIPNAEEWAIHDYEGYEGARLEEYSGIEKAHTLALFIVERGRLGAKLLEHFGGDLDEAEAAFENYAGQHADLAAFAEHLTEETDPPIPDNIAPYVDYRAMGRDLEIGGDIFAVELGFDEVHVFWSRRGVAMAELCPLPTETTPDGKQVVVPGIAPITLADRLALRAAAPMQPTRPQRPCDHGLGACPRASQRPDPGPRSGAINST